VVWGCFESLRLILKLAPGGRLPARTLMMSASHSLQLVAPINYMKRVDYQHTHTHMWVLLPCSNNFKIGVFWRWQRWYHVTRCWLADSLNVIRHSPATPPHPQMGCQQRLQLPIRSDVLRQSALFGRLRWPSIRCNIGSSRTGRTSLETWLPLSIVGGTGWSQGL